MRFLRAAPFLVLAAGPALAEDSDSPPPLFVDVAAEAGFRDVPGKTVAFADLNGDGWLDVVLDRRRVFLSQKGAKFVETDVGIEFPKAKVVPMTQDGKPDLAKAAEREIVPQVLHFADLDGDGDLDAVATVHSDWEWFDEASGKFVPVPECDPGVRTAVWLNDGKGRFTRGPESGLTAKDAYGPSSAVTVVDYDRDGNADLFEGREYRRYGVLYGCGVDRLWKGDGKGGFTDVTEKAGMMLVPEPGQPNSARPSYGVTAADFDNDGWTDLLTMAYGRQWNLQWRNRGDGTFTDVGRETGFAGDDVTHGKYPDWVKRPPEQPFRSNGNTFDCAVADFNNDGALDCFLGEIQHAWAGESSDPPSLLLNLGKEHGWKFLRRPVQEFLPKRSFRDERNFNYGDLHAAWLDYDLDGLLDLLIASGDYPDGQFLRLYRQRGDHSFEEVLYAPQRWEGCGGVSIGDFDRDGDPDILVGRSFMRLSEEHRKKYMGGITVPAPGLLRNDATAVRGRHWLNVRLEGKGAGHANRAALGARVYVTTGDLTQMREIRSGSGLGNHQDPTEQIFGLGDAKKIDRVVVRWPGAKLTEQTFTDVPVDRFVTFVEGEPKPRVTTGK
jgi:hypothetical protein